MHDESAERRRVAREIHDKALAALSVTRNNEIEITSSRQLDIVEDAARRILSLRVDDRSLDDAAYSMLARVAAARRWTWVDPHIAVGLTGLALVLGVGSATFAGIGDNVALAVIGGVVSSLLLCVVVLRYRRQNWRVRAEHIAPMIWQHGA